jgi:CBS domain containing-hemolysin-like protein
MSTDGRPASSRSRTSSRRSSERSLTRSIPSRDRSASKGGEWLVQADLALADLCDYGIELDTDTASYHSVAGLMLDTLGHLPRSGERITTKELSLTVEAVRESRIDLVRVSRNATTPDAHTP